MQNSSKEHNSLRPVSTETSSKIGPELEGMMLNFKTHCWVRGYSLDLYRDLEMTLDEVVQIYYMLSF